jgi:hypothetical protein
MMKIRKALQNELQLSFTDIDVLTNPPVKHCGRGGTTIALLSQLIDASQDDAFFPSKPIASVW